MRKALATTFVAIGLIAPIAAPLHGAEAASRAPGTVASRVSESFSIIRFVHDGVPQSVETTARNVADLLTELGLAATADDYLSLAPTTPLTSGLTLELRSAVPVTLIVGGQTQSVRTSAATVASLLTAENVTLGALDRVTPSLDASIASGATVRVQRVNAWTENLREPIAAKTENRLDFHLKPNEQRVLRPGVAGIRETTVRIVEVDGVASRTVIGTRIARKPQPRIMGTGVGVYNRLTALALRGAEKTMRMAGSAMRMIATAYTAGCAGCSGYTAIGVRAGRGIVAVDPRVIPLGTRLYITGYGPAIAGDTGGAIHGNRIDLGFESNRDARLFGRRAVDVYVLH